MHMQHAHNGSLIEVQVPTVLSLQHRLAVNLVCAHGQTGKEPAANVWGVGS